MSVYRSSGSFLHDRRKENAPACLLPGTVAQARDPRYGDDPFPPHAADADPTAKSGFGCAVEMSRRQSPMTAGW
jgi:hypothetical protein